MRKQILYWIFPLLFIASLANATNVSGLNVAIVPVANTSASARQAVLSKALGQVLVKLSGNPTVMTVPAIQNALDNMDVLIQSYSYLDQKQSDGQGPLRLQVTFDQSALKQLLQRAGQAEWPSNRPLTLLWIQILNGNDTSVLSNTNDVALSQEVQQAAKLRGIPILLPAMDLQDQSLVNEKTETFNQTLLKQVSDRYGTAAILAGNIQQNDGQWEGSWLLLMNDTPYQWRNKAGSIDVLFRTASEFHLCQNVIIYFP